MMKPRKAICSFFVGKNTGLHIKKLHFQNLLGHTPPFNQLKVAQETDMDKKF